MTDDEDADKLDIDLIVFVNGRERIGGILRAAGKSEWLERKTSCSLEDEPLVRRSVRSILHLSIGDVMGVGYDAEKVWSVLYIALT